MQVLTKKHTWLESEVWEKEVTLQLTEHRRQTCHIENLWVVDVGNFVDEVNIVHGELCYSVTI